jgi:hypothetical protein
LVVATASTVTPTAAAVAAAAFASTTTTAAAAVATATTATTAAITTTAAAASPRLSFVNPQWTTHELDALQGINGLGFGVLIDHLHEGKATLSPGLPL